jgi:large subunit ribosomal protein L25
MDRVKLVVTERTEIGTRAVKRLRRAGKIPGVLYGSGRAATAIAVDPHELRVAVSTEHGTHAVFDVTFEGRRAAHHAVIQEVQLDPVKHVVAHLDLREVKLNEPIEAAVGLHVEGMAPGVKAGGLLDVVVHEIHVKCLPADIPEHLVLAIDEMQLGEVARIKDLVPPEGVTILDDQEEAIATIIPPRGAAAEEEAVAEVVEGEEQAEPEIVGKGHGEEAEA